jgi:CHAD domain-containing protein
VTTSAQREFILGPPPEAEAETETGAGDIDGNADAALASAALSTAFTVSEEPHPPGSVTKTWLDTFDWRLRRAGVLLEYAGERRNGRLLLTKDDGTPLAEQPITGWPPRRPVLPEQLPPGPVRDALIPMASPRALLPQVKAISTVHVARLLNSDGKTVARLITNRATVSTPTPSVPAKLPPRLAIAEVRGYHAQASKAAALLAAVPRAAPATENLLAAARHALGLVPPPAGLDAGITASMPAPVAVARLLLRMLDTLELNIDGVLRDLDTEFLHDLRVAVRRTRSAIKLLRRVLPPDLVTQYAAQFKSFGDLTTPTRDLDVHLLGFPAMAERLVAAAPHDLDPFRDFLARRRTREFRRLAAVLRAPRFGSILHDWRQSLTQIRDTKSATKLTAAALAESTTRRVFRKITAEGNAITPASPAESLHDLRKRCKDLRYLLEFFAPLHDPVAYKKVVGDLKQLQDCLGEFQDSHVQREEIHALAEAMLAERAAPAATLLAMGEIAAQLVAGQADARDDFARRFARFGGPAGQQRFRELLRTPAPR